MNTQEYLKYLLSTDEWTAEDKKWMQQYLEANDLSDLETVALESFNNDEDVNGQVPSMKVAQTVLNRIHQQIQVPSLHVGKRRKYRMVVAIAASLLIIAGAGYLFKGSIAGLWKAAPRQQSIAALEKRTMVKLPDGSAVMLEPRSIIEFPERFEGTERVVKLNGEAFFEVYKDKEHPFVIHTKQVKTTVLGTSFAVEAYAARPAKVVVVTGTVRVQAARDGRESGEVVITANQSAVYNNITESVEKGEAGMDAQYYDQRQKGKFIYNGAPIEQVVKDIERFFNVPVTVKGKISACSFYGSFYTTDDLEKALSLVVAALNAKVNKDAVSGSYTISGGACN